MSAKTKYILIGGYVHKAPDGGEAFCKELVKDAKHSPVRILDCMFARPEDIWQEKFEEDKVFFAKFINNFELELATVDNFTEQVKLSDAVYVRGGDTQVLQDKLNISSDWHDGLKGKTFAGTSSGAEVIAKYAYNIDYLTVYEHLGILPIKFIPHWMSDYNAPNVDWNKALAELKSYGENLEIITLKEGEFKVLEI